MEPSRSILYPRCRRAREAKSVHGSGCIIFYKWGFAWQTAAVRTRYYNSWGLNDDDGTSTSCVLFILWMHSVLHIRKVWKWNGEIDLENNNNNKAFLQFLCQIFSIIWFKTPNYWHYFSNFRSLCTWCGPSLLREIGMLCYSDERNAIVLVVVSMHMSSI